MSNIDRMKRENRSSIFGRVSRIETIHEKFQIKQDEAAIPYPIYNCNPALVCVTPWLVDGGSME